MTDFDNGGEQNEALLFEAKGRATEILNSATEAVDVAELIVGAPLVKPPEQRDQAVLPEGVVMTRVKERAIRAALTEIGIGIAEDMTVEMAELPENTLVFIEGGQRHKERSETRLAGTGPLVFSGTKHRNIGDKERELTARLFGLHEEEVGETEYDSTMQEAKSVEGFEAFEEPLWLGSITYTGENAADAEEGAESAALLQIGIREGGSGVYVFEVPRKYLYDAEGEQILDAKSNHKYQQPSAAQQAIAIAQLLEVPQIALTTSSTYYPSRLTETVRTTYAAIKKGMTQVPEVTVLAYCPQTLAEVKQEDKPAIPSIEHVLGEAYATRESLEKLKTELTS